jgi:hypothetical protein
MFSAYIDNATYQCMQTATGTSEGGFYPSRSGGSLKTPAGDIGAP